YILGVTGNELGGSEYYEHLGYVGLHVPQIKPEPFKKLYQALAQAIDNELIASAHGIYRGGLGVHLAMVAMGGNLGMQIDLAKVPVENIDRSDMILFSESAGRFIVTIDPKNRDSFEKILKGHTCACVGTVTEKNQFIINGTDDKILIDLSVQDLKDAWEKPFGGLI
ncbi:MAG: phosphoribosylformylglycinamidine synthase, partial [Deltaproteobacteria bacterium]|nr:phosphoribosylformylglycinamidine synthase [Deltaproteobacteria bacterium]